MCDPWQAGNETKLERDLSDAVEEIKTLQAKLATVTAERDRLRDRVGKLEKVREAAVLYGFFCKITRNNEDCISRMNRGLTSRLCDDCEVIKAIETACEEKEPTP